MKDTQFLSVLSLGALLVLSAFFSGSETALIAAGRVKLSHLVDQGSLGAKRALRLLREPSELLAVILVGNNLVNVTAAALATTLIGPLYATIAVTLVLLVFAEITPKSLAALNPEYFAVRVSLPVQAFGYLFRPVVWITTSFTDVLLWTFSKGKSGGERKLSRQELLMAIKLGESDGELEPSETRMTQEVLSLKDRPVAAIMIPLDEVDSIAETATFEQIKEEFVKTGNTRYPVYRGEKSEMVGMLLVKDFLMHPEGMKENWLQYVRPLMRVKADLEADELLRDMQIQHSHMAAVEDDENKVIGIVTMEDVLEEIVGEIQDEYDDDEGELIREFSPDRYSVRADAEVDDLCKVLNVDLGQRDQNITLKEWFERRMSVSGSRARRVKSGQVQVIARGPNRFELWIKGRTEKLKLPVEDAEHW